MKILEVDLKGLGFSGFKELIDLIIPKKERRQSRIIVSYIRVYTYLNNAFNLLSKEDIRQAFEYLLITKKIIKQLNFQEEMPYLKRISDILNSMLRNKQAIIMQIRKNEASDPFHIKTSVLLAQNICILRILKINKY